LAEIRVPLEVDWNKMPAYNLKTTDQIFIQFHTAMKNNPRV